MATSFWPAFRSNVIVKYLPNYPTSEHKLNFFPVVKIVLEAQQGAEQQYHDVLMTCNDWYKNCFSVYAKNTTKK